MKKALQRTNHTIVKSPVEPRKRLMISVPMTGLIRSEWAMARYGQIIPCNWSQVEMVSWLDMFAPLGFLVADARNVAVQQFIAGKYDWLYFIDHDVVLPHNTFVTWNQYMLKGDVPIFGGLYFTKSVPSEPLTYRGAGQGYFPGWTMGEKVWLDGMGLGNTMLHRSILEVVYKESEEYAIGQLKVRRVFSTPGNTVYDAAANTWTTTGGTEDLTFFSRLQRDGIYRKAGWGSFQEKPYPLLCDTAIFSKHIDWDGVQYPSRGEEQQFARKG